MQADTCGTLVLAAKTLMENRAKSVYALVTHGVLSSDAVKKIEESSIVEMIITNSISQTTESRACKKIKVIDLAPMLSEAIRRTHNGESISVLFSEPP
jgi:ribose-phosphate pyrophosphokinase